MRIIHYNKDDMYFTRVINLKHGSITSKSVHLYQKTTKKQGKNQARDIIKCKHYHMKLGV